LLDKVTGSLKKEGIQLFIKEGVRPNPDAKTVRDFIGFSRENGIDSIFAIGGGSVIDTAKAVGAGFYYEGDFFDFNLHKTAPKKCLPIGVVLTISSAGSESSNSCVIQDDETKFKGGINSDLVRPLFVVENPELTYGVSAYQTAVGASDIMMHSLERYFDPSEDNQLSDEWALSLVKNVMIALKRILKDPKDYEGRAALMLDSSLSHNGLTGIGKPFGFVVHPIEHALSGYKPDIVHGAGVALIFPAWATYTRKRNEAKLARMARVLFNESEPNDEKASIIGIASMREFFRSIGMPTTLKEVELGRDDIPSLAALATGNNTRMIGCCHQSLGQEDVERILASLL
jgi:alcohol dehydrogenase YqhD (iron-dependent ADH family)